MSDNTTGTPSVLKQVMLAINMGYDDNDKIQIELIYPNGFEKDHPKVIEISKKHAEAWYKDILKYSRRVPNKEEEE